MKITGIEIELNGEKKIISVEAAREMLSSLQGIFGAPAPTYIPWYIPTYTAPSTPTYWGGPVSSPLLS